MAVDGYHIFKFVYPPADTSDGRSLDIHKIENGRALQYYKVCMYGDQNP